MKFYDFEVVIEKEPEDEGYFAYSPSLPGCFSNGMTIEETRRNIRVAIQQHIAALLAHNQFSSSFAPLNAARRGC